MTDPGTVMGTVGYMAPEQVRGQAVDARTDLFAFGAVLYEMLSGQRAFRRDTAADTMIAIVKEDPPDLLTARADLPPPSIASSATVSRRTRPSAFSPRATWRSRCRVVRFRHLIAPRGQSTRRAPVQALAPSARHRCVVPANHRARVGGVAAQPLRGGAPGRAIPPTAAGRHVHRTGRLGAAGRHRRITRRKPNRVRRLCE